MFGHGSSNGYLRLAEKRIQHMERAFAILERRAAKMPAQRKPKKLLAELKRRRADFDLATRELANHIRAAQSRMRKLTAAGTTSWSAFQAAAAKSRKSFSRANRKSHNAVKKAMK